MSFVTLEQVVANLSTGWTALSNIASVSGVLLLSEANIQIFGSGICELIHSFLVLLFVL